MCVSLDIEAAARQIAKGRDLIAQLRALGLADDDVSSSPPLPCGPPQPVLDSSIVWPEPAEMLFEQVLGAFDTALSVLVPRGKKETELKRKGSPEMANEDEATKKRGKQERTWSNFTSNPDLDGYQWRKYGEKSIQGDKYRRSYFRCTYKREQGCKATKQVQCAGKGVKSMFLVTYKNNHTCQVATRDLPLIPKEDEHFREEPVIIKSELSRTEMSKERQESHYTLSAALINQKSQEEGQENYQLPEVLSIPMSPGILKQGEWCSNAFNPLCAFDDLHLDYQMGLSGFDFGILNEDGLRS